MSAKTILCAQGHTVNRLTNTGILSAIEKKSAAHSGAEHTRYKAR